MREGQATTPVPPLQTATTLAAPSTGNQMQVEMGDVAPPPVPTEPNKSAR